MESYSIFLFSARFGYFFPLLERRESKTGIDVAPRDKREAISSLVWTLTQYPPNLYLQSFMSRSTHTKYKVGVEEEIN